MILRNERAGMMADKKTQMSILLIIVSSISFKNNSFACWIIFHVFCRLLIFFFKINFFEKLFQECYHSVKQFGSRLGPTLCWS